MDQVPMQPPPAAFDVQKEYLQKKSNLEQAFKDFHELTEKKVLNSNKSPAVKRTELEIVGKLVKAAQALDNVNVGEGILALASIAIRELLVTRDSINKLDYEICLARREIRKLQDKIGGDSDAETK